MTEILKMKYKEAKVVWEDPNETVERKSAAKDRMDSIKAWMEKEGITKKDDGQSEGPTKPSTYQSRRALTPDDFKNLDDVSKKAIQEDATKKLEGQLCRIYHIEQQLQLAGITPQGPFVGMLFNEQTD